MVNVVERYQVLHFAFLLFYGGDHIRRMWTTSAVLVP